MLYHQKSFAQVKFGTVSRNSSQIFRPRTRWFDCFQNCTSARSRLYQPLPTIPCSEGASPVRYVLCAEHVTAGKTGVMVAACPRDRNELRFGVFGPSRPLVNPTTLR